MPVLRIAAELALDARAVLAEGPVWEPERGALVWVDIRRGRLHQTTLADRETRTIDLGEEVGSVAWRRRGGYIAALRDGIAWLDADGRLEERQEVTWDVPDGAFNDGKCDRRGCFWAGSLALEPGGSALYRIEPDHTIHRVLGGVTMSNGLGWSPDDHHMYYVDTPTQGLDVFEFSLADGSLGSRRRLVSFPRERGEPDGLTVDCDGCVWIAMWGVGEVHRYAPDGRLLAVVTLPVTAVTSVTFAGAALDELWITTARDELSPAQLRDQPLAGGLFRALPGVCGLPPHGYAG